MTKIFARAWQKFVKSVVLYADNSNYNILHYDQEYLNPVPAEELKELFNKGLIVIEAADGSFIRPSRMSLSDDNDLADLIYAEGDSEGSATIVAFHSAGWEPFES